MINLFSLTLKSSMLKHRMFTTGKFESTNSKKIVIFNQTINIESSHSKNIDANGKSKTDRSVQWALNRKYVL